MKYRNIIIAASVFILFVGAFFLGRWTEAPKKKTAVKRETVRTARKKAPAAASKVRAKRAARIAIVMDDFGYNMNNIDALFAIGEPVTLSVLPNLRRSRDVAESARRHGYEVILHLPLEASRNDVREEDGTLKSGSSGKMVVGQLDKDINSVPGLVGVSNHMGSKATEDRILMSEIFTYLKKKDLYFFDSLTSEKSVCAEVAGETGVRFAKRDMFLDNSNNVEAIQGELQKLKALAIRRGRAIAICHDRKNTLAALAKSMPDIAKDGVEFVYLSELVR